MRREPGSLTVNIGDLLEYWSGRRWPSWSPSRTAATAARAEEDLVSLIYFYEANHDALLVTPLEHPSARSQAWSRVDVLLDMASSRNAWMPSPSASSTGTASSSAS